MTFVYKLLTLVGAFMVAWSLFGSIHQISYMGAALCYIVVVLWLTFNPKGSKDFKLELE
jgi:hypothetical protein